MYNDVYLWYIYCIYTHSICYIYIYCMYIYIYCIYIYIVYIYIYCVYIYIYTIYIMYIFINIYIYIYIYIYYIILYCMYIYVIYIYIIKPIVKLKGTKPTSPMTATPCGKWPWNEKWDALTVVSTNVLDKAFSMWRFNFEYRWCKNEEDTWALTLLLYIGYILYILYIYIYIYGLLQNCKVAVHWTVGPVFKDGCDGSKMCPHHFQILLYGKCRG